MTTNTNATNTETPAKVRRATLGKTAMGKAKAAQAQEPQQEAQAHLFSFTLEPHAAFAEEAESVAVSIARHAADKYHATVTIGDTITEKRGTSLEGVLRKLIDATAFDASHYNYEAAREYEAEVAPLPVTKQEAEKSTEQDAFRALWAGSNEIGDLAADIVEAAETLARNDGERLDATHALGTAISAVKARFAAGTETAEKGNAAWGLFVRETFRDKPAVLTRIDGRAGYISQVTFLSSAPKSLAVLLGANTETTFEKNVNGALGAFVKEFVGETLKDKAFAARFDRSEGGHNFPAGDDNALEQEIAVKFRDALYHLDGRVKEDTVAIEAKGAIEAKKLRNPALFDMPAFVAKARGKKALTAMQQLEVMAWLVGLDYVQISTTPANLLEAFDARAIPGKKGGVRVGKAWAKLVSAFSDTLNADQAKEAKEAQDKAEQASAAGVIAKAFGKLSVDAAAEHLLHILVAHAHAGDVLDALTMRFEAYIADKEAQQGDDEQDSEQD